VSEQPDFLVAGQALPYVLCLRADSDWKHAPQKSSGHKVSPLVLELWKALDKEGALSAAQARETLGRELTEAAVLRALCELWQALRVSPVFAEPSQPARWELLRVRHRDALSTAGATGQVTALSLLVSMYLQSVYAASSEEIEIFLSPVASRSRIREAVRGLSATRQIHSLSMDAQTYYFLEGGLPEFAEPATPPATTADQARLAPRAAAGSGMPRRPLPALGREQAARPARPAWSPGLRSEQAPGSSAPVPNPPAPASLARGAKPRPAAAPPATDWKGPRRPAAKWQPAVKPPMSGARRPGKDGVARPSLSSPRKGAPAGDRPPTRPDTGGGARADRRPGAWTGAQKRDRSAPWARPGPAPGSYPPRTGGRHDSRFRPTQKPRFGPRAGSQAGSATGTGIAPGRPPGSQPATGANRPPAGRPPRRAAAPFGSSLGTNLGPNLGPNLGTNLGRSNPERGGPPRGGRPSRGPAGARTGPASGRSTGPSRVGGRGPDRSPGRSPGRSGSSPGRSAGYDRPRPGGYAKSGANPGSGEKGVRPPFVPGSRPAKSWPQAGGQAGKPGGKSGGKSGGTAGGKPGKPAGNFRARKPARKRPGA
jgi:hypothetical protein